jgi:hypothetical protein
VSAFRIVPAETAFSHDGGRKQRRPRAKADAHLHWIRTLPCIITGRRDGVEAAHIRFADPRYGKRATGMQEKPDDCFVLPLHRDLHSQQHATNERSWWSGRKIDPVPIAMALYQWSGDDDRAQVILAQARAALGGSQ